MASRSATKDDLGEDTVKRVVRGIDVGALFSENVLAKILQVAHRGFSQNVPLETYPHTVPQIGESQGRYEEREADFWTCGFFPGSIYALLERATKWPNHILDGVSPNRSEELHAHLLRLGRHYGVALNRMSGRKDTHDMGFIVQPALQKDWELTGNSESLQSVTRAAHALASRWDPTVGAIRSWDRAINYRYSFTDMSTDFLVIIDSMCNLDLLYFVGHLEKNIKLIEIATAHAHTVMKSILRDDFSSYHLVNFDPETGQVKAKMTNQGHTDDSCWSRGQAWAIMGFAQTYQWTRDPVFLETAIRCTDYFLRRMRSSEHQFPLVPVWDFDAPQLDSAQPLRDTSAAMAAANGMLLIQQALTSLGQENVMQLNLKVENDYLQVALDMVQQTLQLSLDRDLASFEVADVEDSEARWQIKESRFDAILRNATTNNNEHAHKPYKDHGLVYADYYFLEFGNKLLRMGLL